MRSLEGHAGVLTPTQLACICEHMVQMFRRGVAIAARRPPGYIQGEQSDGLKPKDLVGMAWRVAFALQDDGWWLRSPVIWDKPNPMPESVADRLTTSHEYVFMLAKSGDRLYWAHPDRPGSRVKPAPDYRYVCDDTGEVVEVSPEGWRAKDSGWRRVNLWQGHDYFFDGYAIREPLAEASVARISQATFWKQQGGEKDYRNGVNPARSTRRSLENLAPTDTLGLERESRRAQPAGTLWPTGREAAGTPEATSGIHRPMERYDHRRTTVQRRQCSHGLAHRCTAVPGQALCDIPRGIAPPLHSGRHQRVRRLRPVRRSVGAGSRRQI